MPSSLPGILQIYGLTALGLASSVTADYYVDNANNTVAYAASGTNWRTFSFATQNLTFVLSTGNVTVDSSKCYDQNYALAACTVENNCQITFPFTGSGLSVYVIHAGFQGITASLKIDGGQSVTATLPPPTPPSYQTPNVSLFDLQFLPNAPHTATINLLDWENDPTSLYFDYALINESRVEFPVLSLASFLPSSSLSLSTTSLAVNPTTLEIFQSPTAQPTTASSTSPTTLSTSTDSTFTPGATSAVSNTKSSVNLRTIVGGACGGLAAFIAITAAIIFLKKRVSHHVKLEESRRPDPFPATPALAHDQTASSSTYAPTNEKGRMHPAALNTAVSQPRGQSVSESSTFHILLAADNAGRVPGAEAGPLTTHPLSLDDFIIDYRREDGSFSSFRDSGARDTPPPTAPVGSAPPCYQTLEGAGASDSPL